MDPDDVNGPDTASVNWEPVRFSVGDLVVDPARPKWGVGRVVEDCTFRRSPTIGQRLTIEWEGRGLVTLFTGMRALRIAPPESPGRQAADT